MILIQCDNCKKMFCETDEYFAIGNGKTKKVSYFCSIKCLKTYIEAKEEMSEWNW